MEITRKALRSLREESILKSALYSARIEGNPMTWDEAKKFFLNKTSSDSVLLPKRIKILNLLNKGRIMNLKQIKKRFAKINERTLRYDLKKLQDQKLIKKLGTTRGVYYSIWK